MKILGISAYYHDSAAALIEDGNIVCAAQEERFTRKKHDASFPRNATGFCLDYAGLSMAQLDAVVFYEKPLLTFERLLETYLSFAPRGFTSFARAMPVWLKEKLYLKQILKKHLADRAGDAPPPLYFSRHHQSHAASAFYPGPFQEAAVLCMDGVGECATTSAWLGRGKKLEPLWDWVIRARRVNQLLPVLESVLAEFGQKASSAERAQADLPLIDRAGSSVAS